MIHIFMKTNLETTQVSGFDKILFNLMEAKDLSNFSIKDKIFFLREIWYLVEGWVSILEAVKIVWENSSSFAIKKICDDVYGYLKKWETFSRAISRMPKYFNDADVWIIKSWENSWELVRVLQYLATEYEYLYDIRSKYLWAMVYPALLFVVSIVAIWIIVTKVLPAIFEIVKQFDNAQLPFATKALMAVSNFFAHNTLYILFILLVLGFWLGIIFSLPEWKRWADKTIFELPLVWRIIKYYHLVRFLRFMKLLIYSGMTYNEVFVSLKKITNNSVYQDMIDDMLVAVKKWLPVSSAMSQYKNIIPVDVVVLLKVWEETAAMWKSLDNAIWLYESEFKKMIDNLSKIIEPIMIIFVGWVVGFIAISVFGIIWTILDSLQQ